MKQCSSCGGFGGKGHRCPTIKPTPAPTCEWKSDDDGNWWTSCSEGWVLVDGSPTENSMKYCPFCGKALIEAHRQVLRLLVRQ